MPTVTIIAAVDKQLAIAKNGKIPWHLAADMKHFSEITAEGTVVMGRKTYESLPSRFKPLPGRKNVIITKDVNFPAPGCWTFQTINPVLECASVEVFVIGGAEIYKLFMPYANRLIITHVETKVGGDVFFPKIEDKWRARFVSEHPRDKQNDYSFTIVEYKID